MNNIVYIAQVTGTISILILFCLEFYLSVHEKSFQKSGRIALLWTSIYVFFLLVLRILSLLHIGTMDQLRIISGFAALTPTLTLIIHLFLIKKITNTSVL